MNIRNLTEKSIIYTSNAWLCNCDKPEKWCKILIDTGCDILAIDELREIKKRTGRTPLNHVILTHNHYDHAQLLCAIKREYEPVIHASSSYTQGVDHVLNDGDVITCGSFHFEIIAIPGHTSDSVCIYCPEEEVLFSGDTPINIWGSDNTYEQSFVRGFEILSKKKIRAIYPGHGEVIHSDIPGIIRQSLINLKNSRII
ncbi:MAG: MBL fold metallo-hydrolase [Methanomicrobiales archaeon]|nr:MBL fold metallo-hydrolase [Methanomicrobiales archaeon]